MKSIIFFLLLILASSAFSQDRKDTLKTIKADEVTVSAERSYSAASDAEFRAADLELRPKNSAQDMLRVGADFLLQSMQEFNISYNLDHIILFANIENLFDLNWDDIPIESSSKIHSEYAIINDARYVNAGARAVKLGVEYRF